MGMAARSSVHRPGSVAADRHQPDRPAAFAVPSLFPVPLKPAPRRARWTGQRLLALLAGSLLLQSGAARAFVALLGTEAARPLQGQFNTVPVLHSNQPEEVEGPGILIDTSPGSAFTTETGAELANATYRFNGAFGLHLHHKYAAPPGARFVAPGRRSELPMAAVLINPGRRPVRISFERGAVRNSFEAPYLGTNLMGVKPLGPRPWNTGPGDATAVQMLRGRLDRNLDQEIILPPLGRVVLFRTALPALGVANALLRGHSDGPFDVAVVAAPAPGDDASVLTTLDSRRLAPGRTYLPMIEAINNRTVFSRVGGVALGDAYTAAISHNLPLQGPLHVPLTSTDRTHFGSGDVQVNPLLSRMVDSSLDNVGTYGVRFDLDLNLRGEGNYALVLSHPNDRSGRTITAFRGSIEIRTPQGQQDVHVGMRSGESLTLTTFHLEPDRPQTVRVSLVYPADSTPGHLLSVVSEPQLVAFRDQERQLELARLRPVAPPPIPPPVNAPPPLPVADGGVPQSAGQAGSGAPLRPLRPPGPAGAARANQSRRSSSTQPLRPPQQLGSSPGRSPLRPPATLRRQQADLVVPQPQRSSWLPRDGATGEAGTLVDRYRQAVEAQERMMRRWSAP